MSEFVWTLRFALARKEGNSAVVFHFQLEEQDTAPSTLHPKNIHVDVGLHSVPLVRDVRANGPIHYDEIVVAGVDGVDDVDGHEGVAAVVAVAVAESLGYQVVEQISDGKEWFPCRASYCRDVIVDRSCGRFRVIVGQVNEKVRVYRLIAVVILCPIDAVEAVAERSLFDVRRNHQPFGCFAVWAFQCP